VAGSTPSADETATGAGSVDGETPASEEAADEEEIEARVGWRYTLAEIRRDRSAFAGLIIVVFMTGMATFAFVDAVVFGWLAQYQFFADLGMQQYWIAKTVWISPTAETAPRLLPTFPFENAQGASQLAHPLGTDDRGRDILMRLIYGSRIAIQVGIVAAVFGMIGGSIVGAIAGYYGGWVDDVLMRGVEILYAIPFLILVLALLSVFQARGNLVFVMLTVGLVNIPEFSRLIRSRVVSVREEVYVEAARAAGVSNRNIIRRHVIPNSFTPVLVQGTLRVGTAILVVAGLAFLGFGVSEPTPSWGMMLSTARDYMLVDLWFSIWPGLMILITVFGFNLFGDGLRDALDPRLKN
jgi:peptide/nickel transport system permease protein